MVWYKLLGGKRAESPLYGHWKQARKHQNASTSCFWIMKTFFPFFPFFILFKVFYIFYMSINFLNFKFLFFFFKERRFWVVSGFLLLYFTMKAGIAHSVWGMWGQFHFVLLFLWTSGPMAKSSSCQGGLSPPSSSVPSSGLSARRREGGTLRGCLWQPTTQHLCKGHGSSPPGPVSQSWAQLLLSSSGPQVCMWLSSGHRISFHYEPRGRRCQSHHQLRSNLNHLEENPSLH